MMEDSHIKRRAAGHLLEGRLDPKRILIVEDEEGNIAVISNILELMLGQQELFVARDGHEAIHMAYQHEPDLILMDLVIPKLDGWQVARSLKNTKQFKNTPILAVTAQAMVGDREKALQAGCDGYMEKPIEVDEFISFVQPYLGNNS